MIIMGRCQELIIISTAKIDHAGLLSTMATTPIRALQMFIITLIGSVCHILCLHRRLHSV